MSLWKIALRSIQQRFLASSLTAFSMSLGVALVVAVLVIYGVVDQSFRRSAQGFNYVVGAPGSKLELVLSTVFQIGKAPPPMSYDVYDELKRGRLGDSVKYAVPICIGDSYQTSRVIGTTSELFGDLTYSDEDKRYEFAEGRNLSDAGPQEAVLGAIAARKSDKKLGDTLRTTHSAMGGSQQGKEFTVVGILKPTGTPVDQGVFVNIEGFWRAHARVLDRAEAEAAQARAAREEANRAMGITAEEKAVDPDLIKVGLGSLGDEPGSGDEPTDVATGTENATADGAISDDDGLPRDRKRITAIYLLLKDDSDVSGRVLQRQLQTMGLQAVSPVEEVSMLFTGLIGNLQVVLLILAVLIVVVAGIGILVSIYNSMNERRREIAIMRALGAQRKTVMMIILLESILLALGGGALGLVAGHALTWMISPIIADQTGVMVDAFVFQPGELYLIPGLILLASAVGLLPAAVAYRTDVAQSLIASP